MLHVSLKVLFLITIACCIYDAKTQYLQLNKEDWDEALVKRHFQGHTVNQNWGSNQFRPNPNVPPSNQKQYEFIGLLPRLTSKTCSATSRCTSNLAYRTQDGSCNNLKNPDWGKAVTPFQRILKPAYGDGVGSPRSLSVTGSPLLSPRTISSNFAFSESEPSSTLTLLAMQWGQFLDHDVTLTANGPSVTCCQNGQMPSKPTNPECFPIPIAADDPFYKKHGQRCMQFVRSKGETNRQCGSGLREQINDITAYIDGNNIYGSDDNTASSLREKVGGRLLIQSPQSSSGNPHHGHGGGGIGFGRSAPVKGLLPDNPTECTLKPNISRSCFKAGDIRVNEQIDLALMHTIWMREHNRVANILSSLHPEWNDEITFQETRKVIIAQLQHITYNEYLPVILGHNYMRKFGLIPGQIGAPHTRLYDPNLDPTITGEFATAAYRFGHSMIQGIIEGYGPSGQVTTELELEKVQTKPFALYDPKLFDELVRGLATQPCQKFDNFFTRVLTNHLFEGDKDFGQDLMSLNIQRGRDHGIPSFNELREVCGLGKLKSWTDVQATMTPIAYEALKKLYKSEKFLDDIDLFVGGLGETQVQGALIGPTFICINGDMFNRLRKGDRFWYEEVTGGFNQAQLDEIRKTSMGRVFCDNSEHVTSMQPKAFLRPIGGNKKIPCEVNPGIEFGAWAGNIQTPGVTSTSTSKFRPPGGITGPNSFNFGYRNK